MMIEGRTKETKKRLIALLFEQLRKELGIKAVDIEIFIQEAPAYHFGFRGMSGDEVFWIIRWRCRMKLIDIVFW
jgi:4-oxalocrotonate tautomerase family enzyme